jgi:NodT family efflux transporter outer membrane factor (OMF) lipoprotein
LPRDLLKETLGSHPEIQFQGLSFWCFAALPRMSVYLACTPLGRIGAFRQPWRFEESITYADSTSLLVRFPPPLPNILLTAQVDATRELITINADELETLRHQFAKGYVSRLDVAAQEMQLAQVSATLPPLLKQLAQQGDLLAALSGGFPSQDLPERFELSSLQLPQELPLSLPSQLVEQRPDVRQAEENLHSASAQIGISIANRLPNFALTADAGSMAVVLGHLFSPGTGFWDVGASVAQPIFDGGTLLHRERAVKAAYTEASEQYRSIVLTAFQNVADTLNALQQDAEALKASAAAKDAATVALDLSKQQYQSGYANYLALLSAEQAYQQALINLVQAQSNRYADTAALFQALGGGWWNRADVPKS